MNSHTGETPPFGIRTVPPILKSSRETNHPYVLDRRIPSTTKNRPAADRIAPSRSNGGLAPWMPGSAIRGLRRMIAATTSTCSRNDHRQPAELVMTPPISGPAAAPSPAAPLMMPKFLARDRTSGKATVTRM